MLYRLSVAGIIAFWLLMAALLVRMECFSGEGELLPVPVSFVTKLMFRHEQSADLVPYAQGRRLDGLLHVQPRHLVPGPAGQAAMDVINASGSFALSLPGFDAQRAVVRGISEMDGAEQLERIELTVSLHGIKQAGPGTVLFLEGWPLKDDWRYEVRQSGVMLQQDRGTVSALLATLDPHIPGLDLSHLEQTRRQQASASELTAHRGTLKLNGEEIDTYVVALKQGSTIELTVHFNQLGQILAVKTVAGYDLYDEGLTP